ncbi:MAG: HAMP domain-containing histidine kinase, partial [Oligoflexia bacterium]|nr:HAMP domain-containing histidine kinase [Oligoflexia bacterium]
PIFAKLGSKATKMDYVNLTSLVEEVSSDNGFDPKLDIELSLSDLPEVWGNAPLLRRVLQNLISNAVKYNDKPKIQIGIFSPGTVTRALGRFAQIRVQDNGPGIPQDELAGIFSMFRRGSQAEGQGEGAGIGLAVVKRIVELHFGEIEVESHPGEGTAFTFTLPVEKISVEASE